MENEIKFSCYSVSVFFDKMPSLDIKLDYRPAIKDKKGKYIAKVAVKVHGEWKKFQE